MIKVGKMNDDVKKVISKTKVFPVATASKNGIPNVVPIGFVKVQDDYTLLIADNFMGKTYKNIEENPRVSLYVCDTEAGKSYQIKGEAAIIKSGKIFDDTVDWVKGVIPQLKPKSAVMVKVTNVYNCQPGAEAGKEI